MRSSGENLTEIFQILTAIEILSFAHNSRGTNDIIGFYEQFLKMFKKTNFNFKIFKECIQRETGLFHIYILGCSAYT